MSTVPRFLNETLHPKAQSLINHIINCACRKDNHDSQFYNPLKFWREANNLSEEKTADLYARLEDAYPYGGFLAVSSTDRMAVVSKALWANDKAVLA